VRLRLADHHTNKLAIEAPEACEIERFRVATIASYATLEGLELATGVKVGGRNRAAHSEKEHT
jgi:hypothetical protein